MSHDPHQSPLDEQTPPQNSPSEVPIAERLTNSQHNIPSSAVPPITSTEKTFPEHQNGVSVSQESGFQQASAPTNASFRRGSVQKNLGQASGNADSIDGTQSAANVVVRENALTRATPRATQTGERSEGIVAQRDTTGELDENEDITPAPPKSLKKVATVQATQNVRRPGWSPYRDLDYLGRKLEAYTKIACLPICAGFGLYKFKIFYRHMYAKLDYWILLGKHVTTEEPVCVKMDKRGNELIHNDLAVRKKLILNKKLELHDVRLLNGFMVSVFSPISSTLPTFFHVLRKSSTDDYYDKLLSIGRQCVAYVEDVHINGFFHRDINLFTFMLPFKRSTTDDLDKGPIIFDFAHAINWKADERYSMVDDEPTQPLTGKIFEEEGGLFTRRDDIENLAYVLLCLFKGIMKWERRTDRKFLIFGKKTISHLNKHVKGIPQEIRNFLKYSRMLKGNEEPDYSLIVRILSKEDIEISAETKQKRKERAKMTQELLANLQNGAEQTKSTPKQHRIPKHSSAELSTSFVGHSENGSEGRQHAGDNTNIINSDNSVTSSDDTPQNGHENVASDDVSNIYDPVNDETAGQDLEERLTDASDSNDDEAHDLHDGNSSFVGQDLSGSMDPAKPAHNIDQPPILEPHVKNIHEIVEHAIAEITHRDEEEILSVENYQLQEEDDADNEKARVFMRDALENEVRFIIANEEPRNPAEERFADDAIQLFGRMRAFSGRELLPPCDSNAPGIDEGNLLSENDGVHEHHQSPHISEACVTYLPIPSLNGVAEETRASSKADSNVREGSSPKDNSLPNIDTSFPSEDWEEAFDLLES